MTEREITLLGFKKELAKSYEGDTSYYYALDVVDGITFITPMNDEVMGEEWSADFFNTQPPVRFTSFGQLQGLLNQLTSAIVK